MSESKDKQPGAIGIDKNIDDDEKEEKNQKKTRLDVAFILDCTASMSSYIQSCKDNIISISNKISNEVKNCDVEFALVLYRDIPPQDKTFVTKILNFTPITIKIQIELEQISARGGGDIPEALASALYDCYHNLKWRKSSIKIIIVITDAPPHGLEVNVSDGFPSGDPDTFNVEEGQNTKNKKYLNIIDIIQSIRDELKAAIYSVACEPDLSCSNDFANDFMQYIAEYTKGRFLPLSSAKLLPEVIVGSVKQQIRMNNLKNRLDDTIREIKEEYGDDISSDKLNKLIMEKWKKEGVKKKEISIGTLYRNKRSRENINLLMNAQKTKSLQDFKANCTLLPRMKISDFRHLNTNKTAGKDESEEKKSSAIAYKPVRHKKKNKKKEHTSFDAVGLATLLLVSEDIAVNNENLTKLLTAANIKVDAKYIDEFSKAPSKGMDLKSLIDPNNAFSYEPADIYNAAAAYSYKVKSMEEKEEESEESSSKAGGALFGADDSSSDDDDDDDESDSCASQQVYSESEDLDEEDLEDLMD